MSKRGLFVFPAAASLVNFAFGRGASMHCRGLLLAGAPLLCSKSTIFADLCGTQQVSLQSRRGDGNYVASMARTSTPSSGAAMESPSCRWRGRLNFDFTRSSPRPGRNYRVRRPAAAPSFASGCPRGVPWPIHTLVRRCLLRGFVDGPRPSTTNARWNLFPRVVFSTSHPLQSSLEALARRYGIKRLRLAELC